MTDLKYTLKQKEKGNSYFNLPEEYILRNMTVVILWSPTNQGENSVSLKA